MKETMHFRVDPYFLMALRTENKLNDLQQKAKKSNRYSSLIEYHHIVYLWSYFDAIPYEEIANKLFEGEVTLTAKTLDMIAIESIEWLKKTYPPTLSVYHRAGVNGVYDKVSSRFEIARGIGGHSDAVCKLLGFDCVSDFNIHVSIQAEKRNVSCDVIYNEYDNKVKDYALIGSDFDIDQCYEDYVKLF